MISTVKIYDNGRITIPQPIRDELGVGPGDLVVIEARLPERE